MFPCGGFGDDCVLVIDARTSSYRSRGRRQGVHLAKQYLSCVRSCSAAICVDRRMGGDETAMIGGECHVADKAPEADNDNAKADDILAAEWRADDG